MVSGEDSTDGRKRTLHGCVGSNVIHSARLRGRRRPVVLRGFGLGIIAGALFGERAHQVHQIPSHLFWGTVALTPKHLALTVADDEEELSIGQLLDAGSVAPIVKFQLHFSGEFALAVTILPVTHGAVVTVKLAGLR